MGKELEIDETIQNEYHRGSQFREGVNNIDVDRFDTMIFEIKCVERVFYTKVRSTFECLERYAYVHVGKKYNR